MRERRLRRKRNSRKRSNSKCSSRRRITCSKNLNCNNHSSNLRRGRQQHFNRRIKRHRSRIRSMMNNCGTFESTSSSNSNKSNKVQNQATVKRIGKSSRMHCSVMASRPRPLLRRRAQNKSTRNRATTLPKNRGLARISLPMMTSRRKNAKIQAEEKTIACPSYMVQKSPRNVTMPAIWKAKTHQKVTKKRNLHQSNRLSMMRRKCKTTRMRGAVTTARRRRFPRSRRRRCTRRSARRF
mmetsp:Transcript_24592/g.51501  ORF Transcript_24592/g.51501 Transcript_24592/m.51501 type:complete len:239 (-) Transcript_24592:8992-9708(-)